MIRSLLGVHTEVRVLEWSDSYSAFKCEVVNTIQSELERYKAPGCLYIDLSCSTFAEFSDIGLEELKAKLLGKIVRLSRVFGHTYLASEAEIAD